MKSYAMGVLVGGFLFSTCYYTVQVFQSQANNPAELPQQNDRDRFSTEDTLPKTETSRAVRADSTVGSPKLETRNTMRSDSTVLIPKTKTNKGMRSDSADGIPQIETGKRMRSDSTVGNVSNSISCPPSNKTVLQRKEIARLDCRKRLPQAIGIGVEKCGTGALAFFLRGHPAIAHAIPLELYYWNHHKDKDLEYYRNQMPVSSKYQVTLEKTPSYIFEKDMPIRIKAVMPKTKFILIIRDPVVRAVSDYLHLQKVGWPEFFHPRTAKPGQEPLCYLNTTFEGSVITPKGKVNAQNAILAHSVYVTYLQRWLEVFPRKQFMIIDGDEFVEDPLPILKEVRVSKRIDNS